MDDVLRGLRVGFCLTGSFCTLGRAFEQMELLAREGAIITPILSGSVNTMDTCFFTADEVKRRISEITQEPILTTIQQVEPIGPRAMTDLHDCRAVYGQYAGQAGMRDSGHGGNYGGKVAPAAHEAGADRGIDQRRAGRGGAQYRSTDEL